MTKKEFKISWILTILALLSIFLVFFSYNNAYGIVTWNGGAGSEEFQKSLNELEQNNTTNSLTMTYQYTFVFDKNNGNGNMENCVVEAKTQNNTAIQDPGFTFPENAFSPPLFHKFKCWSMSENEYFPGDRINSLKTLSGNSFKNTTIHVLATYEFDAVALIISIVILISIILIILLLYKHFKNKNKPLFANENLANQNKEKQSSEDLAFDDKMLKYKKLLDEGIITEEEFNKKKKEILDL